MKVVRSLVLVSLLLAAIAAPAGAEVKLPALVSDHMVLQQGIPARIWGRAAAGEAVTVEFRGQKLSAAADAGGKWAVFLKPMQPGAPANLTVSGQNTIVVRDVLVGEVWVGSGQSNMGWTVARSNNAEQEIAEASFPAIRMFEVERKVADSPADDVVGQWRLCSPETAAGASAAGYYFSRDLHRRLSIPIGFIHSSWGGTPAQSWTSRGALESEPPLQFILDDWKTALDNYPSARERYDKQLEAWKPLAAAAKSEGKPAPTAPRPPAGPGHQNTPGGLYNAMIAPLTPYAIRGVIWYQGESNASPRHALPYRRMFRLMIEEWRKAWKEPDFPFLFVQLANFKANDSWPVLRESQADALALRKTGMAVSIDIGESNDIHPRNKQEVGRRLALAARAIVYGEKVTYSGPMYRQLTAENERLRIWFDHVGGGLEARNGGSLTGFTIAGKDGNFVPAEARIDGPGVLVWNASVKEPAAVRYAWADDPAANLINKEGLPASPFRAGL